MTSIHGLSGAAEHAVYAGTKGAIIASTRALAVELALMGIRVNAIAPGWIHVENHAADMPAVDAVEARELSSEKVPAGRYGLPIDVARLAVFLCSDEASFIIGQTIVIDGGTTALMSLMSDFRTESNTRSIQGCFARGNSLFLADFPSLSQKRSEMELTAASGQGVNTSLPRSDEAPRNRRPFPR